MEFSNWTSCQANERRRHVIATGRAQFSIAFRRGQLRPGSSRITHGKCASTAVKRSDALGAVLPLGCRSRSRLSPHPTPRFPQACGTTAPPSPLALRLGSQPPPSTGRHRRLQPARPADRPPKHQEDVPRRGPPRAHVPRIVRPAVTDESLSDPPEGHAVLCRPRQVAHNPKGRLQCASVGPAM